MAKRVLVTGANGQLGLSFKEISKFHNNLDFTFLTRENLDISNEDAVAKYFTVNIFDVVINCAAYTAVDLAESDEDKAYLINAVAIKNLAKATAEANIPFVHFSTDYVFDGNSASARNEKDAVDPINVYGKTKLEGENFALSINNKTVIIRTSWVYSRFGNNFVKTMLRLFKDKKELSIINDQIGSPTNAIDLADGVAKIIGKENLVYGIFNYSNLGECSWYDFAVKIKELSNSSVVLKPVNTELYPTPAKRPKYSLLDKTKITKTYQIEINDWEQSLKEEIKFLL